MPVPLDCVTIHSCGSVAHVTELNRHEDRRLNLLLASPGFPCVSVLLGAVASPQPSAPSLEGGRPEKPKKTPGGLFSSTSSLPKFGSRDFRNPLNFPGKPFFFHQL